MHRIRTLGKQDLECHFATLKYYKEDLETNPNNPKNSHIAILSPVCLLVLHNGKKCSSCYKVFSRQDYLRKHIQNAVTECQCSQSAKFGLSCTISKHYEECDETADNPCCCLTDGLIESGMVSRPGSLINRWYTRDIVHAGDQNLAESKLVHPTDLNVNGRPPWKRKLADLERVILNDTNIEMSTLTLPSNVHVYEFKKYLLEAFPGVEFSISATELAARYHHDWSIESSTNKVRYSFQLIFHAYVCKSTILILPLTCDNL